MTTGVTENKSRTGEGVRSWKGRVSHSTADPRESESGRNSCQPYHALVVLFSPSSTIPSYFLPRGQPSWLCPNPQVCSIQWGLQFLSVEEATSFCREADPRVRKAGGTDPDSSGG